MLLGDVLYKKSYSKLHFDTYLRCLRLDKLKKVMQKIHDGDFRVHAGGHFLHKAINEGITCPRCSKTPRSM